MSFVTEIVNSINKTFSIVNEIKDFLNAWKDNLMLT